ncbi:MAG TPA: sorbitol dehydrogenase [Thermoanaerobaculia bacterium]|nr:sorbitol dehydrogenase [Thermoanaerobaculia bacterium]
MSDPRMTNFLGLSQALTGIATSVLAPGLDTINLKTTYLQTLDQQLGQPATDSLLQLYANLKSQGKTDAEIAQVILTPEPPATPQQAGQAGSLMKMWLLGSWYPPTPPGQPPNLAGTVISVNAYTGSFAWTLAQAHPMGYSELAFGYWSSAPPPLPSGIPASPQGGNS